MAADQATASGQRSVLGGLDDTGEVGTSDDIFEGGRPSDDVLQYLQSVRTQASKVPELLIVPPTSTADENNRTRASFEDGAFFGALPLKIAPRTVSVIQDDRKKQYMQRAQTAQNYLTETALARFKAHRASLNADKRAPEYIFGNPALQHRIRDCIRDNDPSPGILLVMDETTQYSVIAFLTKQLEWKVIAGAEGPDASRRFRSWLAYILLRLDEDHRSSERDANIRALAGKAGKVLREYLGQLRLGLIMHSDDATREPTKPAAIGSKTDAEAPVVSELEENDFLMGQDDGSKNHDKNVATNHGTCGNEDHASSEGEILVQSESPNGVKGGVLGDLSSDLRDFTQKDAQDDAQDEAKDGSDSGRSLMSPASDADMGEAGPETSFPPSTLAGYSTGLASPPEAQRRALAALATIDHVLLIVGSVYHQYDLLDLRQLVLEAEAHIAAWS